MNAGVGEEGHAVPWEVGAAAYQNYYHRDVVVFAIDCGPSMHELEGSEIPLLTALRAAARLMEIKLVSSPKDHVGILLWNTVGAPLTQAKSSMTTETRSGFRPNTVEYTQPQQVNVPTTYALRQLIACTCVGLRSDGS